MRQIMALDLKDDAALIARYEAFHRNVWPEVERHLRNHGVTCMEIYRLGTRLVMLMETDDAVFRPDDMARAAEADPKIKAWEDLMWTLQAPTPWTPAEAKWIPMTRLFALDS